ncbi:MAG: hypothetical protein COA83_09545 [Methylophaga sp.]|nr:MAG: hypothetical protein COA83_09545 [Methylophaga sp.]
MFNQNVNFNNVQPSSNKKQSTFIDASSLSGFFMEITEYIYEKQQGGRMTVTAKDIVLHSITHADSQNEALLTSFSEMIDLMADLGWLDIHAIGTTFDDELLYKFKH